MKIQGWYIKPPDFDPSRKYPMQLHIHGGPHSMYGVGFNFGWQEHAANDYVILYTNPRGSTGYGSAFGNAIKNAYPGKDYDDLMAGVDAVLAKGFVDPQNMFVTGCSGGGVLTAWIVGHTDRFAAASANCPVIDWLCFVGTTDGASWYYNFEKLPWEDPSEHLKRSPLTYVGNVKTPTMLMTGVNDLRTPMPQTEQFYSALKLRKVPTAMIRFNDEWHGTTSMPSNFMRTQLYLRYWFDKYKRGAETKTTAPIVRTNRSGIDTDIACEQRILFCCRTRLLDRCRRRSAARSPTSASRRRTAWSSACRRRRATPAPRSSRRAETPSTPRSRRRSRWPSRTRPPATSAAAAS